MPPFERPAQVTNHNGGPDYAFVPGPEAEGAIVRVCPFGAGPDGQRAADGVTLNQPFDPSPPSARGAPKPDA